jgi:tRNA pseudouridine38-40 synthase
MPNYRLLVEYDGTDLAGWQVQAQGARTVQGCLTDAIERISGERVRVTGAGRTDAGVHAEGQVASFSLGKALPVERLLAGLNGVLPRDIGIREVAAVPDDFDALRCATGKRYVYRLWNGRFRSPLRARRFLHVPRALDLAAMRAASADLVGEHDFSAFRAAGSDVRTSVRRLDRIAIAGEPGGEIELVFEGGGFLRHMVRNLVGTLLEVGHGRRPPDSMPALLATLDRDQAGPTAPAHGLCLERVDLAPAGLATAVATARHSTEKPGASDPAEA